MKSTRLSWLAFGVVAAAVGLSSFWLPAPLPANAPATSFSAMRALEHVKAIAQAPHPAGSADNARVREYLLAQMSELGLRPRELAGKHGAITLVNLYGELEGSLPAKPRILLVSHYDSTPAGPGAADAASGVGTILETIRALKARGPLRSSLGVLMTDGEELGLRGAEAWVRDHSALIDGACWVLNLEARGNRGPVLMFETARDNARLIQLFSRAGPAPLAASFSQDIYRRMPNDTDFTVFLKAGKRGFNFSFVGGLAYYHSPQDTPENLSLRTLQHYGSCVLPLAALLGQADDRARERLSGAGDATFFPVWRGWLVCYPSGLARALALMTAGLFGVVVGKGLWNSTLRVRALAASLGVCLLATVLAIGVGAAGVYGLVRFFRVSHDGPFVIGVPFEGGFLLGLLVVAAAITLGLRAWLLRRTNSAEALAGTLAIWAALTLVTTATLPGASYLFMWPALLGTLALWRSEGEEADVGRRGLLPVGFTAVPASLILAPTILLLHQAITIGIAPVSAALVVLAVCLMPLRPRPNRPA